MKSWTWLSDFTFTFQFHALEKEMATHSSILTWIIPGTGAWWAAVYGVTQSRTQLTWLSSSSNINQRLEISREATTIRSPFIAMKNLLTTNSESLYSTTKTPNNQKLKKKFFFNARNVLSIGITLKFCHSVQFSSVTQSCPTLCDPMNRSTPGLPVHHQLPEFTQTYVHRVGDAIQPSHPLLSPFPPAPNPSQH